MTTRGADWLRQNLFRSWRDALLTAVAVLVLGFVLYRTLGFIVGSDWDIVRVNMRNFLVGPEVRGGDAWGVAAAGLLLATSIGLFIGALHRRQHVVRGTTLRDPFRPTGWPALARTILDRLWPLLALAVVVLWLAGSLAGWLLALAAGVAMLIARGVGQRLPDRAFIWVTLVALLSPIGTVLIVHVLFIPWTEWGGFLLVLFAGGAAIVIAFPIGLLLALGRRSKLPAIKYLSIGYIEFVRGVPLVVFLFIGSLVIGLLLPAAFVPSELIRATIVLFIFTAAYVAEIVRGGLQALPAGQEEAAKALGMPAWRTMSFIVLPQALRNVIPALVGQAISLWKDTSLLFIIGVAEPLRLATAFTRQPEFRGEGLITVTLFFAALIYWVVSFTMSRESQRLERKLGVGER